MSDKKNEYKLAYKLIPFMRYRTLGFAISCILVLISILFVGIRGLNWGLDFTGGTVVETTFSKSVDVADIRQQLSYQGYEGALVQTLGSTRDIVIRLGASEENTQVSTKIIQTIHSLDPQAVIKSVEFVGPNVGKELAEAAVYGTLLTLAMLLIYLGMRFEWRLALGGIVALFHDVMITLGLFSLLQIEIDLTFVAAILSVVGYSLNDSIVIFDRVRENFRKIRRESSLAIVDISLSQTLSRTLVTSLTTLVVVIALFYLGGPTLQSFSLALMIGVGIGTYSSIYIAIGVALTLGLTRESMIVQTTEKEGADIKGYNFL